LQLLYLYGMIVLAHIEKCVEHAEGKGKQEKQHASSQADIPRTPFIEGPSRTAITLRTPFKHEPSFISLPQRASIVTVSLSTVRAVKF
jgi:hypothetical protein